MATYLENGPLLFWISEEHPGLSSPIDCGKNMALFEQKHEKHILFTGIQNIQGKSGQTQQIFRNFGEGDLLTSCDQQSDFVTSSPMEFIFISHSHVTYGFVI